jgi:hypothetical protein
LILLEGERMPRRLVEPAAGNGAIVNPLRASGRQVTTFDIHDYGLPGCIISDYFDVTLPRGIDGAVTNPPFKRAQEMLQKLLGEVGYVALLLRTNFLMDGAARGKWLDLHPPTREWWPMPRLPMMHHINWTGNKAGSNTPHTWAIWDRGAKREFPTRFYWRELLKQHPMPLAKAA